MGSLVVEDPGFGGVNRESVTGIGRRVLWRYGLPLFRDLIAPNKSHRDRSETMLVIWQRWANRVLGIGDVSWERDGDLVLG